MSQRAQIELLHGRASHADPTACVEDVSAELAWRRVEGFPHSIAALVFHMNYWMNYELRRIRGERPKFPEHAAESWPTADVVVTAEEWDQLRRDFAWFLAEYEKTAQSSSQVVVHNSYHVGQIAMIRRMLGAWPPRGGGDTW